MTEHDPKAEEHVEDLDVPESESDEVKGGLNFARGDKIKKVDVAQKWQPGNLGSFGDGSV